MKALVYHGPGQKAWEEVPTPTILDRTDAIVRVDATTICGTDLHILKGDVPAVTDGGSSATRQSERSRGRRRSSPRPRRGPGAGVLHHLVRHLPVLPRGHAGQCLGGGGWILGHRIDGTQAEYVRVPFADTVDVSGARPVSPTRPC